MTSIWLQLGEIAVSIRPLQGTVLPLLSIQRYGMWCSSRERDLGGRVSPAGLGNPVLYDIEVNLLLVFPRNGRVL